MGLFERFTGLLLIVLLFVALAHNEEKDFDFTVRYYFKRDQILSIDDPDKFNIIEPFYKPQYKTVFVAHGWKNEWPLRPWMHTIKEKMFNEHREEVNFFFVDWAQLASSLFYYPSASNTQIVGRQLAKFIAFIQKKFSADMNSFHCIGHSLGAHVCGFTGKSLQKNHDLIIGKITGLDPAGPSFTTQNVEERLDVNDAKLVESLHTNMADVVWDGLGTVVKSGGVDIFMNGGSRQAGCEVWMPANYDDYLSYYRQRQFQQPPPTEKPEKRVPEDRVAFSCHHSRAVDVYMETRKPNSTCQPVAYACELYKSFLDGKCAACGAGKKKCRLFEYNADTQLDMPKIWGYSYFIETNPVEPFCANHYQVVIQFHGGNIEYVNFSLVLIGDKDSEEFNLYTDWSGAQFSTLVTTPRNLGNLNHALGAFGYTGQLYETKIQFDALYVNFMSNMNPRIRRELSAEMKYTNLTDKRFYRFDVV